MLTEVFIHSISNVNGYLSAFRMWFLGTMTAYQNRIGFQFFCLPIRLCPWNVTTWFLEYLTLGSLRTMLKKKKKCTSLSVSINILPSDLVLGKQRLCLERQRKGAAINLEKFGGLSFSAKWKWMEKRAIHMQGNTI